MANLVVRNIDDEIVRALKSRAELKGISSEEEHRNILKAALIRPKKKSFSEVLHANPSVASDSDFERRQDDKANDVFTIRRDLTSIPWKANAHSTGSRT